MERFADTDPDPGTKYKMYSPLRNLPIEKLM